MDFREACRLLGVSGNEPIEEIKKEYLKKVKFYHPDNFEDNPEKKEFAEEMTKQTNEAWEFLQMHYHAAKEQASQEKNDYGSTAGSTQTAGWRVDPVYTPVFSPLVIFLTLLIIVSLASCLVLPPLMEQAELLMTYSKEERKLMEQFHFEDCDGGYEISAINTSISGTITIPSTFNGEPVVAIAERGFANCNAITEVILPDNVIRIDERSFYGCEKMCSIQLSENLEYIAKGAFAHCVALTEIYLPDSLKEIQSVSFVDPGVFYGCDGLTTVHIGKNISELTYCTFEGCDLLTDIYLSNTVSQIGGYTFVGCSNIKNIYYDGTLEDWGTVVVDVNAFEHECTIMVNCSNGSTEYQR